MAIKFQKIPESGISGKIRFITIPSLCFDKLKEQPDELATTLYNLLRRCTFVSFTADTILRTVTANQYTVSEELIDPFLCCSSSCDMRSFAAVYLGAIQKINQVNRNAALRLSRIVLSDAKKVWMRGTYYRMAHKNYQDGSSGIKEKSINEYLRLLVIGIKRIYSNIPSELRTLVLDLENC